MRLIERVLLGSLALVLAIPCGTLVFCAAVLIDPTTRDTLGDLGWFGLVTGLLDLASGVPPDAALTALAAIAKALAILLVLPPTFTALIGESQRWRALAWYGGASGVVAAALPWLARGGLRPPSGHDMLAAEGRVTVALFLTGAASGLVYWLIAGRSAAGGRSDRA